MLKRCESVFFFLLLLTGSLFADWAPGSSWGCCDSGIYNWKLDVEFLYFLPTFDDTYFVIQSTTSVTNDPIGTRRNNDFDFKPGFRIGGAFALCGCSEGELQLFYARLNGTQTRTVTGGFLWATVGGADFVQTFENFPGSASSRLSFLYQRVDGLYSRPIWCDSCFKVNGLVGLEYAYIRYDARYEFVRADFDEAGRIRDLTKTKGIGAQFGFNLNYLICPLACFNPGALSFVANATTSLLASRSELSTDQRSFAGGGSIEFDIVSDERTWRIVPAFHTRLGFNYGTCFACWQGSLEIGYEFTSYLKGLQRYIFPDDTADGLVVTHFQNFDVQGLYVAFTAAF